MSMMKYTKWAINHPWHVTGPEPRPPVPSDCDCEHCIERHRLEAAAPDLLEALQGLLLNCPAPKGIKHDFSYILYREAAKKAIAKAKGIN